MNYKIRKIKENEYNLLEYFLYEAIFIPKGIKPPSREIINNPELQVYIKDFGSFPSDKAVVAEIDGKIVGAAWGRIMNDYGHIDDSTPSLAISLYKDYRSKGIGKNLMLALLKDLKEAGYKQISLSVQKKNYALNLYRNLGFKEVKEYAEEFIMIKNL